MYACICIAKKVNHQICTLKHELLMKRTQLSMHSFSLHVSEMNNFFEQGDYNVHEKPPTQCFAVLTMHAMSRSI